MRLTPRISSFFANESLRFAALAAVSVAAWMALGPLLAAALINPNLWAASASARLNVAMSRQRKLLVAVGAKHMAEGPESEEGVPALAAFLKLCREEMAHGR